MISIECLCGRGLRRRLPWPPRKRRPALDRGQAATGCWVTCRCPPWMHLPHTALHSALGSSCCSFAGGPTGYQGPTTPCVEANVSLPEVFPGGWWQSMDSNKQQQHIKPALSVLTWPMPPLMEMPLLPSAMHAGMEMSWDNSERVYSGKEVPCTGGEQTWEGYWCVREVWAGKWVQRSRPGSTAGRQQWRAALGGLACSVRGLPRAAGVCWLRVPCTPAQFFVCNLLPGKRVCCACPGRRYPGVITTHPTGTEDYSIRGKFKVRCT